MEQHVILVDEFDNEQGTLGKMEAHREPHLHRAFSVFLFNANGEMLLQQRAHTKYHSAGLWTNTCCSHPFPGETVKDAANRRLMEEMGITATLEPAFTFTYQADFDNGLMEHEYDHVFIGKYVGNVYPNAEEVESYRFKSIKQIKQELEQAPEQYTEWFKIALPLLEEYLASNVSAIK